MSQNFSARVAIALLLAACLAVAGCDWREFDEYEETAPIRVFDAPNDRLTQYGKALASFEANGRSVVVASSGANTPVVFQRMWTGTRLSDDALIRCKGKDECKEAAGLGETLIPFPVWAHDTAQERTGCVLSPAVPQAYVFCDSTTSNNQSWDLIVHPAEDNTPRFSGVGLAAGHPLGVAILGVYDESNRAHLPSAGRLYYQPDFQPTGEISDDDAVPQLARLPLRDPESGELFEELDEPGDLGFAVAAAENAAGELVIAISQPSRERVIVATYDERLPGQLADKLRTRACLENPEPGLAGFGKRLLVGDINDDGAPEVFAGIDPTDPDDHARGAASLFLFPGAALPAYDAERTDCASYSRPPVRVACTEGVRDVRCEASGFGAALALGDVDGDGVKDLLVGAPNAEVGGQREAGAVWVIPGARRQDERGGLDLDRATNLFVGSAGAQLGMTVTTLRTKDRDEPVAGAPGEARLFTFMCSALEDDVSTKSLCLPR
jgi:FG-GAP repeat